MDYKSILFGFDITNVEQLKSSFKQMTVCKLNCNVLRRKPRRRDVAAIKILAWKHLLKEDVYKEIIRTLQNLVRTEKVIIFLYIIMNKSIDNTINTLLARSTTRAAWCYQQRLKRNKGQSTTLK
jgi:hypothetical protein